MDALRIKKFWAGAGMLAAFAALPVVMEMLFPGSVSGQETIKPVDVFGPDYRIVRTVSQLTNTVNAVNALSIDGKKRVVWLAPGTYALSTYLYVSNNVRIEGAGWSQVMITGGLDWTTAVRPIVSLFDNAELVGCTVFATSTANTAAAVGRQYSGSSPWTSTNCSVRECYIKGDTDGIWLGNAGSLGGGIADGDIDFNFYDCVTVTKFDTCYTETSANGGGLDSPCILRCWSGLHYAFGPSANATAIARGDVTNCRLVGPGARQEHYGCTFRSGGGTNTTSMAFLVSANGTDTGNKWAGGLYLNNCLVEIFGTNMSAGGVGACLLQNTNSWSFLNAVSSTSNNIVGNGTNYWVQPRKIAASTATVGTAADTVEKDLFIETMMANTWSADGQGVELQAWGSYGATANTKALRVKLGAASGSGSLTLLDTAGRAINGGEWYLHGMITRVSKTALKASLLLEAPAFTTNEYASVTLTVTTNIFLRVTGSNHTAAASDLVLEGYKLTHLP